MLESLFNKAAGLQVFYAVTGLPEFFCFGLLNVAYFKGIFLDVLMIFDDKRHQQPASQ